MFNLRVVCALSFAVCATVIHASVATGQTLGAGDISIRPADVARLAGQWTRTSDLTAAGGAAVWFPNAGAAKIVVATAQPSSYFEVTFDAQAGIAYRLWLRLRAQNNDWANDSVFVQFSGAMDSAGSPTYRIGSTSAAEVNLEDAKSAGISGWGWQDNGWGTGVLGPAIYFDTTGPQTLRVQSREDGAVIDQILLSPSKYMAAAPGALKNDTTILPSTTAPTGPSITLVRGPYIQKAADDEATIVWATRESGAAEVRFRNPAGTVMHASAVSHLVPAAVTGYAFDYYQYEARLTGLSSATAYTYDPFVSGVDVTAGSSQLKTAPAPGSGTVTFVAFGDSGTGSADQRQISSLIGADAFDIALHAGDIVYGTTTGVGDASYRSFQDWFFAIYQGWLGSHPFFPIEGNHDSRPSNGNGTAYLDLFALPTNGASAQFPEHAERYYSFDWGPVHFIGLDTEFTFQDVTRRAEQLAWLDADLASTSQPWKIAFFHRSPYSAGGEHGPDPAVQAAFGPLFERHGVQLVISAHEHDYERTVPLRTGSTGSAVTYLVTGGGGAPLYPAGTATWTAFSASRPHYLRGSADDCTLHVDAIGADGTPFDTTTLTRCAAPPPPASTSREVVLAAADAAVHGGAWRIVADTTAAGSARISNPDAAAAKITVAAAAPANYFELTFNADAGVPYRLWIRGKADRNSWANDSVFAQFSGTVSAAGAATYRIGTTAAAEVNLEDCVNCGVSGWGWQDNGYGAGVLGPQLYFKTTGPQTVRFQTREDGFSIDQIVLSAERYLTQSPGALKNDTVILIRP